MATNLLLEGDDLEALLMKAHSEGGPNARIVRADKYRHGGLWGFFARERFEVAVEIPERGVAAIAAGPPPDDEEDRAPAVPAAFAAPAPAPVAPVLRPWTGDAEDRTAGRLLGSGDGYPPATYRTAPAAPSAPRTAPRADGLLGMADRVSAAERAAARAVEAMLTPAPRAPASISLPGTELVGATLASMAAGSRRGGSPITGPAASARGAGAPPGGADGAPAGYSRPPQLVRTPMPGSGEPGIGANLPLGTFDDDLIDEHDPLALLRAVAAETEPPAGAGPDPVRPSGSRPEFTALLDQLREDPHPARTRPAGRTAAYLDHDLSPDRIPDRTADGRTRPGDTVPAPRSPHTPAQEPPRPPYAPVPEPAPAPVAPASAPAVPAAVEAHRCDPAESLAGDPADVRCADPRTAADRTVLRAFGVPAAWTRRLRSGDRFGEVLRMLERMPDPDIHPDAPVVAVVGPASSVRLEAHRTAVDLAVGDQPRPVVVVPAEVGTERATAIARALRSGPVVLAVESDGSDAGIVLDTLTTVQAGAVIALVDAATPLERTQRWLDALGQVDALALEGGGTVPDPATALQLGLPVIRFDGIPVDRVTWAALLCAHLLAAEQVEPDSATEPGVE